MDVHDIEGDRETGIVTVPMVLGQQTATFLAIVSQFVALAVLVGAAFVFMGAGWQKYFAVLIAASALIMILPYTRLTISRQKLFIKLQWIPLMLTIAYFC